MVDRPQICRPVLAVPCAVQFLRSSRFGLRFKSSVFHYYDSILGILVQAALSNQPIHDVL
jgi:hypothetical protein